jgi:hypothetical protein
MIRNAALNIEWEKFIVVRASSSRNTLNQNGSGRGVLYDLG